MWAMEENRRAYYNSGLDQYSSQGWSSGQVRVLSQVPGVHYPPLGQASTAVNYQSPYATGMPLMGYLPSQEFPVLGPYYGSGVVAQMAVTANASLPYFPESQNQPQRFGALVGVGPRTEELARPIDKQKALKRNRYNTGTIARDVLLAAGRHPEMVPLNAHLEVLKAVFPQQINDSTDLSTIRWDLIDPGDPVPEAVETDRDSVTDDVTKETGDERPDWFQATVDDILGTGGNATVVQGQIEAPPIAEGKHTPERPLTVDMPQKASSEAVRKYVNSSADERPQEIRPSELLSNKPISAQEYAAEPSVANSSSIVPVGSAMPSDPPDVLKKGMSYAEYRLAVVTRGKPVANKKGRAVSRKKRPDADNSSSKTAKARITERKPPDVRYPEFVCGWEKCGSRLHNLTTLRKHVLKFHPSSKMRAFGSGYPCLWDECGVKVRKSNMGTDEVKRLDCLTFDSIEALHHHIEKTHISPIAWRLGDGPQGGLSGELYCLDLCFQGESNLCIQISTIQMRLKPTSAML